MNATGLPTLRRVTTPETLRDHVIRLGMFNDGEGKALCGKRPFPDRWEEVMPGAELPMCADCAARATRRR